MAGLLLLETEILRKELDLTGGEVVAGGDDLDPARRRGFVQDGLGLGEGGGGERGVDANGVLRTRDTGANILRGVTRANLITLAAELQLKLEERPFTVAEAQAAREAFFTAASAFVTPVTSIDGKPVGDGRPGPVALRLRRLYREKASANAVE